MSERLYKNIIQGISKNHFKKIFILAGAGISVAAGIPGKKKKKKKKFFFFYLFY